MLKKLILVVIFASVVLAGLLKAQTKLPEEQNKPLFYLDGKELSERDLGALNPQEIASLTVLKEPAAIEKYGKKGEHGVVLMETKKAAKLKFQSYFASKSTAYRDALTRARSDSSFLYVLNKKVLEKNFEGDLSSIDDSSLLTIEVIDSASVVKSYGVTRKTAGVLIATKKANGSVREIGKEKDLIQEQGNEPAILILAPSSTYATSEAVGLIKAWEMEFKQKISQQQEPIKAGPQSNLARMRISSKAFLENTDFYKQVSLIAQSYLSYRFYERFPQTLILLKDTAVSVGITSLAQIAAKERMPYVLAFPEVRIAKEKRSFVAYVKVQLYEAESNSLLLNEEYRGDDGNPGFEFSCHEGSLNCTLNNALSPALDDVIRLVAQNNKTLKAEKALAIQRNTYLTNNVFGTKFDRAVIDQVIYRDSTIDGKMLYHCLYSPKKDKFVGFFQSAIKKQSFKEFTKGNKDKNVQILTNDNFNDKDFFNNAPNIYSYIVKGIFIDGRWYYEKDKVTYFNTSGETDPKLAYLNNLQAWDFFKEASTEPDELFWEGKLFAKIPALTESPEQGIEEKPEDPKYAGMYQLVASVLKKENEAREKQWQDSLSRSVFAPFYQSMTTRNSSGRVRPNAPFLKDHLYIYNSRKSVVINPEEITDNRGNRTIRYFVFLPAENRIYEWKYFPPFLKQKGRFDNGIMKNLNTITTWNYSMDYLDDEDFWNKYVLFKENGEFKYLKNAE